MACAMIRVAASVSAVLLGVNAVLGAPACAGEQTLEALFWKALSAEGKEYLATRDALIARPGTQQFLAGKRETADSWQDRLLAEILLERLGHAEEIRAAVQPPDRFPRIRRTSERVMGMRKLLGEKFKGYPLVLVEFLWKGNELEDYFWGRELAEVRRAGEIPDSELPRSTVVNEKEAYVISALGLLGEKRAAPVLVRWLAREPSGNQRRGAWEAGETLRETGTVQQFLSDLLRIAEESTNEKARGVATRTIAEGGLTPEAVPLLQEAARKTTNPKLRKQLGYKIKILRDIEGELQDTDDERQEPVEAPDSTTELTGRQSGDAGTPGTIEAGMEPTGSEAAEAARQERHSGGFALGLAAGLAVGAAGAWLLLRRR